MRKRKGFKPGEHVHSTIWMTECIIQKWHSKGVYLAKYAYTGVNVYLRAQEMTRLNKFTIYDKNDQLKFKLACIGMILFTISMALAVIFGADKI